MKHLLNQTTIAILLMAILSSWVYAQEEVYDELTDEQKAQDAAESLANPNASIGFLTFPTDYIFYDGDLPDADSQTAFKMNFQPSLPYNTGPGTNLFVRPLIPIIFKQPVYTGNGFENVGTALGDISMDVAYGKGWASGLVGMIGVFASAPTATDDNLGTNRWLMGPEFVLGKVGDWGSFYVLLYQSWSVSGNDDGNISITGGQYFYTFHLGNAWQIQGQPTFSYNHNAPEGQQWTFPVGGGISKTVMFGDLPIKFGVQYWYYVASNDTFGPKSQIRFLITPVVPLPW